MVGQRDSQKPVNVAGVKFVEVERISVNEWHSTPDGSGKPEQVHLMIELKDVPYPMVMRFKSGKPMDSLIVALITHRKSVFGDVPIQKTPVVLCICGDPESSHVFGGCIGNRNLCTCKGFTAKS